MKNQLKAESGSKSIRQLLDQNKYYIDYYQREYRWKTENIIEFLTDLENKFFSYYDEKHERINVKNYGHYFLGSIIINNKEDNFIIDGQQRLTTITLFLIYLDKLQEDLGSDNVNVDRMVYSEAFGEKSFNIDIDERKEVMESISHETEFYTNDKSESVKNIKARYNDIVENFPDSLKNRDILPFFIDWFKENVDLVEIKTHSDDDAYTIFETMNDRGLKLTAADMLKGYILTNIEGNEKRDKANEEWRDKIAKLIEYDKKEEDLFFKAWLRGKYAQTMRDRKQGAINEDYEIIGVQFNRWVRENHKLLNLNYSETFVNFVNEFSFFSRVYLDIKDKSDNLDKKFEHLYYNNYNQFTLQFPLLLAAINSSDSQEVVNKKIQLISRFMDTYMVLRSINRRSRNYSAISYTIFNLIKEIRNEDEFALSSILKEKINEMPEKFDLSNLILHKQNKKFIQFLLARITSYIDEEISVVSDFNEYVRKDIKKPFEIEHIIPDNYDRYRDEFKDTNEFNDFRDSIGNLILIPRGFNQSFGKDPYEKKVEHYFAQNCLAKSLNIKCYQKNPTFNNFIQESKLPFKPYKTFSKEQILEREELYTKIIEKIWDIKEFDKIVTN